MSANNCGRYVYCIAEAGEVLNFGDIGIDDNEVYTIPYDSLCAVVHSCSAEPYSSGDKDVVHRWAISHQRVAETALDRFGTVLPMSFDTIIQDTDEGSAEDNIRKWLVEKAEDLKNNLDRVRGNEEYGVQVFWEPNTIAGVISQTNPELRKLEEEIRSKSKGLAYMYKQRLEKLLKQEMEKEAENYFKDFYHRIEGCVNDIKVEKTKTEVDKQMLINLSCLVARGKTKPLSDELENINKMDGFSVRFTGPWPPYSFVTVK